MPPFQQFSSTRNAVVTIAVHNIVQVLICVFTAKHTENNNRTNHLPVCECEENGESARHREGGILASTVQ